MTVVVVGTSPVTLIEHNKKRKTLSFQNTHASAIVYISDIPNPNTGVYKWILQPYATITFNKNEDFPERAFYAISDTASTNVAVGYQNED